MRGSYPKYMNPLQFNSKTQCKITKKLVWKWVKIWIDIFQRRHAGDPQVYEKVTDITNYQGNTNQNHNEILPDTCQNGYYQKDNQEQVLGRMWRKGNPHTLLVRLQIGAATVENSMEIPQKIKNRTTTWSSNSTSG